MLFLYDFCIINKDLSNIEGFEFTCPFWECLSENNIIANIYIGHTTNTLSCRLTYHLSDISVIKQHLMTKHNKDWQTQILQYKKDLNCLVPPTNNQMFNRTLLIYELLQKWGEKKNQNFRKNITNRKFFSKLLSNDTGKGVATSPTPWCSSYRKGSLRVTLDYGRLLYLLIIKWNIIVNTSYNVSSRHKYLRFNVIEYYIKLERLTKTK